MKLICAGLAYEIDVGSHKPPVISGISVVHDGDALHLIGAEAVVGRAGLIVVAVAVEVIHAVDREHVGVARQAENGEIATAVLRVHHGAGRGLRDVCDVRSRIRDDLDLCLVVVGGDIAILGLDRSGVAVHDYGACGRPYGELHVRGR